MTLQNSVSKHFMVLSMIMCVSLIAANLFETKIFELGRLTLTGGFLVFPISYIVNDCMSEVYGYKRTRNVVLLAFAMNAFVVLCAQIVRILPGASFWDGQEHFDYIFAADLRITVASMAAFILGSIVNSRVLDRLHRRSGEKGFGIRAVLSSLAGESLDSLIFFPIAFWGVGIHNLLVIMVTQIVLKTLYEVAFLPLTNRLQKYLKTVEKYETPA